MSISIENLGTDGGENRADGIRFILFSNKNLDKIELARILERDLFEGCASRKRPQPPIKNM